jgi:catechol 2,3-dioxygenase-like lactoylglutathione lyase family enzyme
MDTIILYVADPAVSVAFYAQVLGQPPVEASANFAMFALESGVMLGLWRRSDVAPTPTATPGSGELAITLASKDEVDARHAAWSERGWPIAQPPTDMDFGYTFVALDPDGYRVRVFKVHAPA